ncbi:MAG TPA: hypothetical protein DCM40_36070 [Maribacter sp.]|nr:hypothetical protein [Maribacter sp.]
MRNQSIFSTVLFLGLSLGCSTPEATDNSMDDLDNLYPGWENIIEYPGEGEAVDSDLEYQESFDPDNPFGRLPVTTDEFEASGQCFSRISSETSAFFNSGTPCIDGMVAIISGRGCESVTFKDNPDGTHSVFCSTEPTCDNVHSDGYLAVPNNLNWNDYGDRSSMICQDSNVTMLYFTEKSDVTSL